MAALSTSNFLSLVDIIPQSDSGETAQNSEPSIAVNPANPLQMIAGTFGNPDPFFTSTDGGTTWGDFGTLFNNDKSIAWKVDGSAVLVATMTGNPNFGPLTTYTAPPFTQLNNYVGSNLNDQPWMRTGPSNHVYVAFNDLGQVGVGNGKTASVNVSTNGGSNYTTVTLDRVGGSAPGAAQDDPAVRLAVNGSRVYAVFDRWTGTVENSANGSRFNSQLVVVRSDNGGADGFTALGGGGNGVTAANHTGVFANAQNTALTLGQERIAGGDLAIAADPINADHVVVAFTHAPGANGAGAIQLVVTESFDGGATWAQKFATSSGRSGQPGVAILANGTIGLLYDNYFSAMGDPTTGTLSQHLLTTTDDFATTNDVTLGSESNLTPAATFNPYLGDFFDLSAIGNTFYGIFSASNADDGTNASFTNLTFNRNFTGTPGTSSFQLTDTNGNAVASSIDPFVFSDVAVNMKADYFIARESVTGDMIYGYVYDDNRRYSVGSTYTSPTDQLGGNWTYTVNNVVPVTDSAHVNSYSFYNGRVYDYYYYDADRTSLYFTNFGYTGLVNGAPTDQTCWSGANWLGSDGDLALINGTQQLFGFNFYVVPEGLPGSSASGGSDTLASSSSISSSPAPQAAQMVQAMASFPSAGSSAATSPISDNESQLTPPPLVLGQHARG